MAQQQDMKIKIKDTLNENEKNTLQYLEEEAKNFENIDFSFPLDEENILYILGFDEDTLVSALSFYLIDKENTLFHCIGATLPTYRKQGCFTQLYREGVSYLETQYQKPLQIEFLLDTACLSGKSTLQYLGAELLYAEMLMNKSLDKEDISLISDKISSINFEIDYEDDEDIYLLYADDENIGEFRLIENGESIYFFAFQIYEKFQNQGLGKSSFAYILTYIYESGCSHILLEVRGDNTKAIHIYERFGFQRMTEVEVYHLNII